MHDDTAFVVYGPDAPAEVTSDYHRLAELLCEHGPEGLTFHVLGGTGPLELAEAFTALLGKDDTTKYYRTTLTCPRGAIYDITWEC